MRSSGRRHNSNGMKQTMAAHSQDKDTSRCMSKHTQMHNLVYYCPHRCHIMLSEGLQDAEAGSIKAINEVIHNKDRAWCLETNNCLGS